jgi:hypothetical protein
MQPESQQAPQSTLPQVSGPVVTPPAEPQVTEKQRSSALLHIGWMVAVFVVAAGVYLWQNSQISNLNSKLSTTQASLKAAQQNQATTGQYITNSAAGVPVSLKTKKIVTTLLLPNDQNVLNLVPQNASVPTLASLFATSPSDILADWQFQPQGTPDSPAQTSALGQVFVSDMTQWANVADTTAVSYPGTTVNGQQLSVASKKTFISQLKTATATCTNDTTKGFTTNDKVFSVCYSLTKPQSQGGSWTLDIQGYGEPASLPVYLGGSMPVGPDATYKATVQKYIDGLKQFKTSVVTNS